MDDCFDKYYLMFNDIFPTFILGFDEYICNRCISEGKDVYELGYVDKNNDKKY